MVHGNAAHLFDKDHHLNNAFNDYRKSNGNSGSGSPLFDRLGPRKEVGTPEDYEKIIPSMPESPKFSTMFLNKRIDAGWTYFGQLISHDITIGREFGAMVPRLNLDCLYGFGPKSSGYLYEFSSGTNLPPSIRFAMEIYLKEGCDTHVHDVLRTGEQNNIPIMADVRNDDNFLLSQLHCTLLRFHNRMAEFFYMQNIRDPYVLFKKTRQFVTWTYQWVIVNEYLRLMTGEVADDLLRKENYKLLTKEMWDSSPVLLPEFIIAALRVGHSQVRQSYTLDLMQEKDLPLFSTSGPEPDLSGFKRDRRRGPIDWSLFFRFEHQPEVQKSRPIDLLLADSMRHIPFPPGQKQNIGEVNIKRSIDNSLVIQEADMVVLRQLGIHSLGCFETELDALYNRAYDPPQLEPSRAEFRKYWSAYKSELLALKAWPLWIFLLLEARIKGADTLGLNNIHQKLGPLGAQIIAEQIIWILKRDPSSYLYQNPEWDPLNDLQNKYKPLNSGQAEPTNQFSIVDVIHIAEHPTSFLSS